MNSAASVSDLVLDNAPGALLHVLGGFGPLLVIVVMFALVVRFFQSPRVKGRIGEGVVSHLALGKLDPGIYRVFNDLVLPRPDGKGTTQIDHVVVSPHGVFVIETKNYAGWIFGDESSRYWTQVLYGRKSRFQNPLHQNALHLRALSLETGLDRSCFHNLVLFIGEATLKTPLPPQVMTRGLIDFIRGHQTALLAAEEVAHVIRCCEAVKAERRVHAVPVRG